MWKVLFIMSSNRVIKSANVLCSEQIINCLVNKNFEVTCLLNRSYNNAKYENINGVKVHRIHRSFFYQALLWSNDHQNKLVSKFVMRIDRLILRFKQFMFIPIYPCLTPLFSRILYRRALKLHKKESFDILITEHYSFESLFAGHLLKKKCNDITFIPIFWDSLSGGFCSRYLPRKYCLSKKMVWEKKLLQYADKIIVMNSSKAHHEKHSKLMPYYKRIEFLDIPLFTKKSYNSGFEDSFVEKDRINVVYTGILNKPDRDPRYIINLFNSLERNDITLIFIGSGNCQSILQEAKKNFSGHLITIPHISHDKLVQICLCADIMLNLGVSNSNAISGKIFEYMSYGKPIISTYYIDNEACIPYLNKYPISLLIDQRENDIQINTFKLNEFINNNIGKSVLFEDIVEQYYKNTPDAYLDLISKTIKQKCERGLI